MPLPGKYRAWRARLERRARASDVAPASPRSVAPRCRCVSFGAPPASSIFATASPPAASRRLPPRLTRHTAEPFSSAWQSARTPEAVRPLRARWRLRSTKFDGRHSASNCAPPSPSAFPETSRSVIDELKRSISPSDAAPSSPMRLCPRTRTERRALFWSAEAKAAAPASPMSLSCNRSSTNPQPPAFLTCAARAAAAASPMQLCPR
mmetsp:Transcript_13149/g.31902  ORF Transcript_13149/g.31902 Transcript_13149/m.31902 type:complete len:207 (-) Transcript_13149:146-766(-)